jgi:hypothetical protein
MYPQGIAVTKTVRQLPNGGKIGRAYRGDQAMMHAAFLRATAHRALVRPKFGRVQVAMGIDPDHDRMMPQAQPTDCKTGPNVIPCDTLKKKFRSALRASPHPLEVN